MRRFMTLRELLKAGTASRKNTNGIGLGLYIAQAVVVGHEGTIDVESTERGTIFAVRLPRKSVLKAAQTVA